MKIRIAAVIMLSVVASGSASAQHTADSVAVYRAVEQVGRSFGENDAALFARLTTDDYTFVAPNGAIQTKAQRLIPLRSGALHYASSQYDEIVVRVYGSTAVATARVITKATMNGADFSGKFRATLVFARIDGAWKMVASHASALTG